jgi:phosphatidylglycerol:prolipoprotein diacylglycerol transferase
MLPSIQLFGIRFWSWGLMNAAATAAALVVSLREARARKLDAAVLARLWPWIMLCAMVGAHVYYLAVVKHGVDGWRQLFRLVDGTAIQGGVIGGSLAAYFLLRRRGLKTLPFLDACAPGTALAHGITRLGCFLAGCCYGRPTTLPWAVTFTRPNSDAPVGVPLHPAQLYETALDFLLAWLLHRELKREGGTDGAVFWKYVGGYGAIRFCVQFFRDDDAGHLVWGMAHSQFLAAGMVLLAAAFLLRRPARSS